MAGQYSRLPRADLVTAQAYLTARAARDGLISRLRVEQRESLRVLILANSETAMSEMERRISLDHSTRHFST